jgi:hypothetical protein
MRVQQAFLLVHPVSCQIKDCRRMHGRRDPKSAHGWQVKQVALDAALLAIMLSVPDDGN